MLEQRVGPELNPVPGRRQHRLEPIGKFRRRQPVHLASLRCVSSCIEARFGLLLQPVDSLVFASASALQIALKSGLVPPEVQRAEVKFTRLADGSIEVQPSLPVPTAKKLALRQAGVVERASSSGLVSVCCWAATLPARRTDEPTATPARVLFTFPTSEGMLALCGELLRLGCDRQEFRVVRGAEGIVSLVRVHQPPWFVLNRALDRVDGLRAWVPTPTHQDSVWTELGFAHPLVPTLELPRAGMLLVPGVGDWQLVADGPWTDADQLVTPTQLPALGLLPTEPTVPRLPVTLKLTRAARHDAPSLWITNKGLQAIEALVRSTPQAALDGLMFAVSNDTLALRFRPGRESASGALPGDPYARLFELPNLYAPLGLTIEPPLRRDRLRSWLANDPDVLSWLEPTGGGGFSRVALPESAFRPLSEWVDYVIEGGEQVLEPWIRSARFHFEAFFIDDVLGPRLPVDEGDGGAGSSTRPRKAVRSTEPTEPGLTRPRAATPRVARADAGRTPSAVQLQLPTALPPSELEENLAREEQAFLALEARSDSSERRAAWVRLAELYSRLNRHREGGLCWGHAIWEADNDEALNLSRRWANVSGTRLEVLLALTNPDAEQAQAFVAHLTQVALSKDSSWTRRLSALTAWLDKFDESLDVRTLWLGRVALSALSGGDALLLARARDRLLGRLTRGLSLERDVPRLLRVTGQANAGGGTERTNRVAQQLESILKAFDDTSRKRSPNEAPLALTRAYVGFEFAWGFARLGRADRSLALRKASLEALPAADPVHDFLSRAYSARIDQALEGLSPEAPLPAELTAGLNRLESFFRYKVDRLRQASTVLEPQERLDPIGNFGRSGRDPRGEELATLRGLRDTAELVKALEVRALVADDDQLGPEERARLLDALLDFLPQLPESSALPLLNRFITLAEPLPTRQRIVVLEDALRVAGHFGRVELVKQLVHSLGSLLVELGPEGVFEVGPALAAGVRSLRRVGLRDEASALLQRASGVLRGEDTRTLSARLALAAGFAYLGSMAPAQPIFDEALARLGKEKDLMPERLRLTRAAARALGHAPTDIALPGLLRLSAQLPWLTDSLNTNSHFCLSLIAFADALVLGHVGDDLTLNEVTRRFLEEDEYLVRRRVHRDAGG